MLSSSMSSPCPLCLVLSFLPFVPLEKHFRHLYYLLCLSSFKAIGRSCFLPVLANCALLTRWFCLQGELKGCLLIHAQDEKLSHMGPWTLCVCVCTAALFRELKVLCSDIDCMCLQRAEERGWDGGVRKVNKRKCSVWVYLLSLVVSQHYSFLITTVQPSQSLQCFCLNLAC